MHSIYFVLDSRANSSRLASRLRAELSLLSELVKLPSRAKLMHRASPSLTWLGSFPAALTLLFREWQNPSLVCVQTDPPCSLQYTKPAMPNRGRKRRSVDLMYARTYTYT